MKGSIQERSLNGSTKDTNEVQNQSVLIMKSQKEIFQSRRGTFDKSERDMKFLKLPMIGPGLYKINNEWKTGVMRIDKYSKRKVQYANTQNRKYEDNFLKDLILKQQADQAKKKKEVRAVQKRLLTLQSSKSNPNLGPGSYSLDFKQKDRDGPLFPKAVKDKKEIMSAGPGSYQVSLGMKNQAFSFVKSKQGESAFNIVKQFQKGSLPGPQSYHLKNGFNSQGSLWSKANTPQRQINKTSGPGPGSYTVNYSMLRKNKSKHKIVLIESPFQEKRRKTLMPGPGHYSSAKHEGVLHTDFTKGLRKNEYLTYSLTALLTPGPNSTHITQPKKQGISFAQAKKPELFRIIDTPAAGAYDNQSIFDSKPIYKRKQTILDKNLLAIIELTGVELRRRNSSKEQFEF